MAKSVSVSAGALSWCMVGAWLASIGGCALLHSPETGLTKDQVGLALKSRNTELEHDCATPEFVTRKNFSGRYVIAFKITPEGWVGAAEVKSRSAPNQPENFKEDVASFFQAA